MIRKYIDATAYIIAGIASPFVMGWFGWIALILGVGYGLYIAVLAERWTSHTIVYVFAIVVSMVAIGGIFG